MSAGATLSRRMVAEGVGTALLLASIVGSGIMGERLAGGNVAVALLANTIATGAALVALILTFGPISGAHFNPAVTLSDASQGGMPWREVPAYIGAQVIGALVGVAAANAMFDLPFYAASHHIRHGAGQLLSEGIATFGLLAVIWGCARHRASAVPFAVEPTSPRDTGSLPHRPRLLQPGSSPSPARSPTPSPASVPSTCRPSSWSSWSAPLRRPPSFVGCCLRCRSGRMRWWFPMVLIVIPRLLGRPHENQGPVRLHPQQRPQPDGRGVPEASLRRALRAPQRRHRAGTLNPIVVEAMRERGIDIASNPTKSVFDLFKAGAMFEYVITVCDEASAERCPVFPGVAKRLHWGFPDPSAFQGTPAAKLQRTREIRDLIEKRIEEWCGTVCPR